MGRTAGNQINFRVTDEEMMILQTNAERAQITVPTLCRNAALGLRVRPQVISKEMAQALLPRVAMIGGHLRELERIAQAGGAIDKAELTQVKMEFDKLWAYVSQGKKPQMTDAERLEMDGQTTLNLD